MRVYVSMTIDKEVKNVIDSMYTTWFQENMKRDRRANPMKYSKSKFIEQLISIGIMFSKLDNSVMERLKELYKKQIKSGKRLTFPEFVERVIKKGLEVEEWLG